LGKNFAHPQEHQTVHHNLWYVVPNILPVGDFVTEEPDHRLATYWVQHTTSCSVQSNAPEDRQNYRPKTCKVNLDLSVN
jgi:hypothetical protein